MSGQFPVTVVSASSTCIRITFLICSALPAYLITSAFENSNSLIHLLTYNNLS